MNKYKVTLETLELVKKLTEQEHQTDWKFGEHRSLYAKGEYESHHKEMMNQLNEVTDWVNRWRELEDE